MFGKWKKLELFGESKGKLPPLNGHPEWKKNSYKTISSFLFRLPLVKMSLLFTRRKQGNGNKGIESQFRQLGDQVVDNSIRIHSSDLMSENISII